MVAWPWPRRWCGRWTFRSCSTSGWNSSSGTCPSPSRTMSCLRSTTCLSVGHVWRTWGAFKAATRCVGYLELVDCRIRRQLAIVDLDSHVRKVYGAQKQGADFSYKGSWSYHPLIISLAGTQECLRLINRPGNAPSAEGAAAQLRQLLPRLSRRFRQVIVRGDSAFLDHEILDSCVDAGQHFAMVMAGYPNVCKLADKLPESEWRRFKPRAQRERPHGRKRLTNTGSSSVVNLLKRSTGRDTSSMCGAIVSSSPA